MNEVSDYLAGKEREAVRSAAKGVFKVAFPITKICANTLASACKLLLGVTKGFKDMAIDGINMSRVARDKDLDEADPKHDKHRHIVGSGTSCKSISKTAKKQGASLESMEMSDKKMLGFETVARKYGIEYGLIKIEGSSPPTWQVHFMAKDRDTMSNAFKDFSSRQLTHKKETPMEQFKRMASKAMQHIKPEKAKRKIGPEL